MITKISERVAAPVQFRRVQQWVNGPQGRVKPGVYINGQWVGDILKGCAFFPEQITVHGRKSPKFRRKHEAKGNVKRLIRNALIEWAISQGGTK